MGSGLGWGCVGGSKNFHLGHPMISYDAHTGNNALPVSQWKQTQFLTTQLAPSIGAIVPVLTLEGWQNALQESRPINI